MRCLGLKASLFSKVVGDDTDKRAATRSYLLGSVSNRVLHAHNQPSNDALIGLSLSGSVFSRCRFATVDQGPSGGYSVARKSRGERVVYEIPGSGLRAGPECERSTHLSRPQGSRLSPELLALRCEPVDEQPTRLVTSMAAQRRSTVLFISNQSFRYVL